MRLRERERERRYQSAKIISFTPHICRVSHALWDPPVREWPGIIYWVHHILARQSDREVLQQRWDREKERELKYLGVAWGSYFLISPSSSPFSQSPIWVRESPILPSTALGVAVGWVASVEDLRFFYPLG